MVHVPLAAKVIGGGALAGFGLYKLFGHSKKARVQSLKTVDPVTGHAAQVVVPVTDTRPVMSQSVVPPAATDQIWTTDVVTTDPNWDWQIRRRGFRSRWDEARGFVPPPITPGLLPLAPTIITPQGAAPLAIQTPHDVQHALNALGFGPLRVDGRIGPQTTQALINFQTHNGLPAVGAVPGTNVHLQNALRASIPRVHTGSGVRIGEEAVVKAATPATPIAVAAATGTPAVNSPAAVQHALNAVGVSPPLKVDGNVANPETVASVKAFQIVHGLVADGVPGPKTRTALSLVTCPPDLARNVTLRFPTEVLPMSRNERFLDWAADHHLESLATTDWVDFGSAGTRLLRKRPMWPATGRNPPRMKPTGHISNQQKKKFG